MPESAPFLRVTFSMDPGEQPVTGAAQRRKQRRLRSWWRHEQQSIAAALATSLHHSSRGQKKARAGEEDSELNYTAAVRKTPPPQPVLFSLYDEEPGGRRPASLAEPPGPQHIVDFVCFAPRCRSSTLLCRRRWNSCQLRTLMPCPKQVIKVLKILPEDVSMRTVVRESQLAPTNPGYALAVVAMQTLGWRTAAALIEQFGDAPAPGRGGGGDRRFSTPPGQGGIEILARDDVDVPSIMQLSKS